MAAGGMDLEIEVMIAAPPRAVYEAITTAAGLRAWWTPEAEVAEAEGATSRFGFGASGWTEMRVDRLVPDSAVEWTCTGQDIDNFDPTDEWVGTAVSFRLAPAGDGTQLAFAHRGLASLGCAELCERGWSHYVREPGRPARDRAGSAARLGGSRGLGDNRAIGEISFTATLQKRGPAVAVVLGDGSATLEMLRDSRTRS